jgi:hypothetical protein
MNNHQKESAGVLLIIVGVIWLFFSVIWMPPFTYISAFVGFPQSVTTTLFRADFIFPLCGIGYGFFLYCHQNSN